MTTYIFHVYSFLSIFPLLFHKCKIAHSRRVFTLPYNLKKKLTTNDLEEGLKLLLNNEEIAKRNMPDLTNHMYL